MHRRKNGKGVNAWIGSFIDHISTGSFLIATGGLLCIRRCKVAFALLDVPRETRAAICLRERVVSFLSRAARARFSGSFLRLAGKSCSVQPRRWSSSALMRSARLGSARAGGPAPFKAQVKDSRGNEIFAGVVRRGGFSARRRKRHAGRGALPKPRDSARMYRTFLHADCRRIVLRRAVQSVLSFFQGRVPSVYLRLFGRTGGLPIGNRRYSRLEVRATRRDAVFGNGGGVLSEPRGEGGFFRIVFAPGWLILPCPAQALEFLGVDAPALAGNGWLDEPQGTLAPLRGAFFGPLLCPRASALGLSPGLFLAALWAAGISLRLRWIGGIKREKHRSEKELRIREGFSLNRSGPNTDPDGCP
jgi:hypothetical protein